MLLHGGAGVIHRASMTPERERAIRAGLTAALRAGVGILDRGGSALDAVETTTMLLEDDPQFNAGRGAVFTADGTIELDASIMNGAAMNGAAMNGAAMDGAALRAGAVAGVTRTRNPIALARAVMEKSPHVMLIGEGADEFARRHGLEQVAPGYFFTERRWQELVQKLTAEGRPVPSQPAAAPPAEAAAVEPDAGIQSFGTVGAVALDRTGNVAAATSTGGLRGKLPGRVGDSAIIGAGTYASNESCAVSGTGTGEVFIRLGVAHEICALVQHRGAPLQSAADETMRRVAALAGEGGVIAAGAGGQFAWSFNTPGMYRARMVERGEPEVAIFGEEH